MYKSLHPLLYILYRFLKGVVLASFHTFFSRIIVRNKEYLKLDRPTILVSNHPNTLMDPLNAASRVSKVVYFLANAGLFKHPLMNKVLSKLYCIPVERPKDVEGRRISNEDNFKKCYDFLEEGGCLYIAPQGGSKIMWRIGKIKTGTARIALGAENQNDFKLGLQIVVVGLTYSDPISFRSQVIIQGGSPILVGDYMDSYQSDPYKAAKQLTADIKQKMESLVIHSPDEEGEIVLKQIVQLESSERPKSFVKTFEKAQEIAQKVSTWRAQQIEGYHQFQQKSQSYFDALEQKSLKDSALVKSQVKPSTSWGLQNVFCALLAPLFAIGWLNHALANGIPWLLVKKLNLYIGYTSNVKLLTALFTYPIFYGLQIWLVHRLGGSPGMTLGYVLFLVLSGLFTSWFMTYYANLKEERLARRLRKSEPSTYQALFDNRSKLLSLLQEAKIIY
ncbi:MAG: 1-acyl-sn-glycerol-3-phosphate acyltransferase [Bacteroidota bacterium]